MCTCSNSQNKLHNIRTLNTVYTRNFETVLNIDGIDSEINFHFKTAQPLMPLTNSPFTQGFKRIVV